MTDYYGNYSSLHLYDPYINCAVEANVLPKSRSGDGSYETGFMFTGSGSTPNLSYTAAVKAFARVSRTGQNAGGNASSIPTPQAGASAAAIAPSDDPDDPQYDQDIQTYTVSITGSTALTWIEEAYVSSYASTP